MRDEEMLFLGMRPGPNPEKEKDPAYRETRNMLRRKVIQRENQAGEEAAD